MTGSVCECYVGEQLAVSNAMCMVQYVWCISVCGSSGASVRISCSAYGALGVCVVHQLDSVCGASGGSRMEFKAN